MNSQDSRNKTRDRIWRWTKFFMLFVPTLGFIAAVWDSQVQIGQYKEQQSPDIQVKYEYNAREEHRSVVVTNTGLVDCDKVWIEESVFLIIDGVVYEGTDVPHLDYFVYKGSRSTMWAIASGDSQVVDVVELQTLAFDELHERFRAVPVCRWRLRFSKEGSLKAYPQELLFIYDFEDRRYKLPEEVIGGGSYAEEVEGYLRSGPRRSVGIHPLTATFELSPPLEFLITDDYGFLPLYPGRIVPLETFQKALRFQAEVQVQPSDDPTDGSLRYTWSREGNSWCKRSLNVGKVEWISKPTLLQPELQYLSKSDREKLRKQPSLLQGVTSITISRNCEVDEVIQRARENLRTHESL